MDTENISISYADYAGQDCYGYVVTLSKPMTVRDFINEWSRQAISEWGTIRIANTDYYCTYGHGETKEEYIGKDTPFNIIDKTIDYVRGYGGWSMSNFTIFVKE